MTSDSLQPASTRLAASHALAAIYKAMSPRRRGQLYLTLALMLLGAIAELMTIGIVIPFLAIIAAPERVASMPILGPMLVRIGWDGRGEAVLGITLILAAIAAVAGVVRLVLAWVSQKFVFRLGHDIGVQIYARMLRQPYSFYVQRNTSEVLAGLEKIQSVIFSVLLPTVQGFVAAVVALCIIALLTAINPLVAIVSALAMGLVYFAVSLATRKLLRHNSQVIAVMQTERIQQVQEGLGGIRDILLDQSQPVFEESLRKLDNALRHAQTVNVFVGIAPRFAVESAGIILIAFLSLSMSSMHGGLIAALPTLGALALGAQRLLPLLQQVYVGWSQFVGSFGLLADVVALLEAPVVSSVPRDRSHPPTPFRASVRFAGVGYRYPVSDDFALRNIDLVIAKGEKIGLVGRTGGGKSTLLDLAMGLLDPTEGQILVDDVAIDDGNRANWQAQIAHVPQFIYLSDSSISANIAFGEPPDQIDHAQVRAAAVQAQIADFIESLPQSYDTPVGERGIRISGGQRQRIGIARALYKRASILILDEATSALDDTTEKTVIDALSTPERSVTMLMIAHRVSTLARCDRLVEVENGRIVRIGDYAKIARPAPVAPLAVSGTGS